MTVPATYFNASTGILIPVHEMFSRLLAPEVFDNIDDIVVYHDLMGNMFEFRVRRRDGQSAFLEVSVEFFTRSPTCHASEAISRNPSVLARLILFLAP